MYSVPASAVGLISNGKVVYTRLCLRRFEKKLPVPTTEFGIGRSVNRFTRLICTAVDEAKSIRAPVISYLPRLFKLADPDRDRKR